MRGVDGMHGWNGMGTAGILLRCLFVLVVAALVKH